MNIQLKQVEKFGAAVPILIAFDLFVKGLSKSGASKSCQRLGSRWLKPPAGMENRLKPVGYHRFFIPDGISMTVWLATLALMRNSVR